MSVTIVTDSTAYIPPNQQQELAIRVIPLRVQFPDATFRETEVDYDQFYGRIRSTGVIPTSSQPPQGEIEEVFRSLLASGQAVLGIFLSSAMSGTYGSALVARNRLLTEFPGAEVEVVDSGTNCLALGTMALAGAREARQGSTLREVKKTVEAIMPRVRFYFVPDTLEYLRKGGRIGGASALLGSLLQIKPVLYVREGQTDLLERVRGKGAAVRRLLDLLARDAGSLGLSQVIVHHIDCYPEARRLGDEIMARFGLDPDICPIGPVIGLHVGPGTLGIVYVTAKTGC